eukprot:tig00020944_g16344.t1
MSLAFARDSWEVQRIFGNGPAEAAEEAARQLTGPHGLASRPIAGPQTESLILLWEMLAIVPRGQLHPTESPPRVLSLQHVEELASICWEGSDSPRLRHCYGTSPRDRAADAGDVRADTASVRREIARSHPSLGENSPHRWLATTKTLGRPHFATLARTLVSFLALSGEAGQENLGSARKWSFLSLEGAEQLLAKLPGRDPAFGLAFKRASLAIRGHDPAEIDLMVPEPRPARRLAIFSKREWLTDTMLANVMTLLLHRMKPNASAKALYPPASTPSSRSCGDTPR